MILAIETATEMCGTALIHDGRILASRCLTEKNIHSERLMVLIDQVLKEADVDPESLHAVAISIGPGSFTGLRIGLSVAKGFAWSLGIDLIAVPTLESLAEGFRRKYRHLLPKTVCAVLNAKRGEGFFACYSATSDELGKLTPPSRASFGDIAGCTASYPSLMFVGDCHPLTAQRSTTVHSCDPVDVALIAERKCKEYAVKDFSTLEPLYGRDFIAVKAAPLPFNIENK